jgi:Na+/proline symporter
MSADRGRRIAVVVLVVLLAVTPVATLLPGSPGSVRVAGVTLLWWYAALIGPLIAALTAMLARTAR